jgi:hypothetical protein
MRISRENQAHVQCPVCGRHGRLVEVLFDPAGVGLSCRHQLFSSQFGIEIVPLEDRLIARVQRLPLA